MQLFSEAPVPDALRPSRARFSTAPHREAAVLTFTLVAIYIAFAGLGRDILFNPLVHPGQYDPIGAVIIYIRLGLCIGLIGLMVLHLGLVRTLSAVPFGFVPFLLIAVGSTLWSVDVVVTLRTAMVLAAFYVAVSIIVRRLGRVEVARTLLKLAGVIVILSALLAVAAPSIGVHSASDALQGVHAGRWRGIFQHKNGLGPWGAYAATLFLFYGGSLRISPWLRWAGFATGLACLIFAGSVTAIAGALTMVGAALLLGLHRRISPALLCFAILIVGGLSIYAVRSLLTNVLPLFGRDESFTGRTEIWPLALQYIQTHWLVGSGFSTLGGEGFFALTRAQFNQALGPENSYLASLLDVGVVGTLLFFGAIVWSVIKGIAALNYLNRQDQAAAKMFMCIMIATLTMSFSEATPFIVTGFTGIANFTALIGLLSIRRRTTQPVEPVRSSNPFLQEG